MSRYKMLSHLIYYYVYYIVCTPEYRFRVLRGNAKESVYEKLRTLCEWKGLEIKVRNVQPDHVHMVLRVPPKRSISEVMSE